MISFLSSSMSKNTLEESLRGRFVTLEGGEGAGKSTLANTLMNLLGDLNIEIVLTRGPGGTDGAERIRTLLLEGALQRWSPMTEVFLLSAARRDHVEKIIQPALARGAFVLCDRFYDSMFAYQAFGYGLDLEILQSLVQSSTEGLVPDATFILDLPVTVGRKRIALRYSMEKSEKKDLKSQEDRYESMDDGFHNRIRDGFLSIAATYPERCHVIDARLPKCEVAEKVSVILWDKFCGEESSESH